MAQQTTSSTNMAGRVMLTLVGAGTMIVSAFMDWVRGVQGTRLTMWALFRDSFTVEQQFTATLGFVVLLLGFVALLGIAFSSVLTRLAGVAAIVVFILLLIQVYGGDVSGLPGAGPWLVLGGGIVAAVGGGG